MSFAELLLNLISEFVKKAMYIEMMEIAGEEFAKACIEDFDCTYNWLMIEMTVRTLNEDW